MHKPTACSGMAALRLPNRTHSFVDRVERAMLPVWHLPDRRSGLFFSWQSSSSITKSLVISEIPKSYFICVKSFCMAWTVIQSLHTFHRPPRFVPSKVVSCNYASRQDPHNGEIRPARLFISPLFSRSLGKEVAPGLFSSQQQNYMLRCFCAKQRNISPNPCFNFCT